MPYGFDAVTEITGPDQAFMVIAYSVLQCVAVCGSVLHWKAVWFSVLRLLEVCCCVSSYVAVFGRV